jgi:hypothetical protein
MHRDATSAFAQAYDVVVVGGGFFGAAAAREAALQGRRVLLVERDDFCSATSANSLKILHGSLRYLRRVEPLVAARFVRDQHALWHAAPHLVSPLACLTPTEGATTRSPAAAALVLFVACAKQMPPPGGPPDKTPPRVTWTQPSADTTHVPLDARIQVRFSERMDARSVERSVFVSPRSPEPPELRLRGDHLEIRLPGGLRPRRTYVVTLGAECSDESRNRMMSSHSFAFATGRQLNQGRVEGRVEQVLERGVQTYVWVYDLETADQPDPGTAEAAYVTQPGADGRYDFPRLGPGRYRLFAVGDRDRDRVYTAGKDLLAVPPADVSVGEGSDRIGLGPLRLAPRDTVGPRLTGIRTPDSRHMVLRFDEPVLVPPEVGVSSEPGTLEVSGLYPDPEDSSRVWLVTAPQAEDRTYVASALGFTDLAGNPAADLTPVSVVGEARPDTREPAPVRLIPAAGADQVSPTAGISITFSEAMKPDIPQGFWVETDSSASPDGRFAWDSPNQLTFTPDEPWRSGATYLLVGGGDGLRDTAGNRCADEVIFRFTVRAEEALGDLSGRLVPLSDTVQLEVLALGSVGEVRRVRVVPGDSTYTVRGLPPGRYRIWGFADTDEDGAWNPGKAAPFVPSEPVALVPDTVEVRSRWEAEPARRLRFERTYSIETGEEE